MPYCSVFGCRSSSKKKDSQIKFHRFPRSVDLQKKWINACQRKDKLNLKTATICSVHFEEKDRKKSLQQTLLGYTPKNCRYLADDAVPTQFLPKAGSEIEKLSSKERKIRLEKRCRKQLVDELLNKHTTSAALSDMDVKPVVDSIASLEQKTSNPPITETAGPSDVFTVKEEVIVDSVYDEQNSSDMQDDIHIFVPHITIKEEIVDDSASDSKDGLLKLALMGKQMNCPASINHTIDHDSLKQQESSTKDSFPRNTCDSEYNTGHTRNHENMDISQVKLEAQLPDGSSNEFVFCAVNQIKQEDYLNEENSVNRGPTDSTLDQGPEPNNLEADVPYEKHAVSSSDGSSHAFVFCAVNQEFPLKQVDLSNQENGVKTSIGDSTRETGHEPDNSEADKSNIKQSVSSKKLSVKLKSHTCNQCDKNFISKSVLLAHQRTHSGEKPFTCDECNKSYRRKSHLVSHKKNIHLGLRPYTCNECGQSYSTKIILVNHQRIHSGLKPYTCNVCDQRFSHYSNWSRHQRIHTGIRPYKCNDCDSSFARKWDLEIHHLGHLKIKPYNCNECDQTFTRKDYLLKHLKTQHSELIPDTCNDSDQSSEKSSLVAHENEHSS